MKIFRKIIIILLLLLTVSLNTSAQIKTICGEVYYTYVTDISTIYVENYIMRFTNNFSFSKEVKIRRINEDKKKIVSEQGTTYNIIGGRENTTPQFFYNNKKEFYFREVFYDKTLLVKENLYQWRWNLHKETKKIGNFICQKATTNFRVRNYIAWFTKEIPVPFGSWKFKNLPGLILEVYDTENVFHIVVVKINIGNNIDCTINVKKETLAKAMTITNYLEKRKQLLIDDFARLGSKMGRSKPLKLDENCDDCSESIEIFNKNN